MPLSDKQREQGWIGGEELPKLPRQELARNKAKAFLDALFAQPATKPAEIRLREGARVARYLKALALSSPPGEERKLLMGLAEATWRLVFEVAPIEMATKDQVIRFLERHERTYLAQRHMEAAIELIRKSAGPKHGVDFFPVPKLVSVREAVQGSGGPRVSDDLSERIYAAYHALRRARLRGASNLVADALNRNGHRTQARALTSRRWGSSEVSERVKQYGAQIKTRHQISEPGQLRRLRDAIVDKWIFLAQVNIEFLIL